MRLRSGVRPLAQDLAGQGRRSLFAGLLPLSPAHDQADPEDCQRHAGKLQRAQGFSVKQHARKTARQRTMCLVVQARFAGAAALNASGDQQQCSKILVLFAVLVMYSFFT